MRKLKLFLTLMLVAFLGYGQVWAGDTYVKVTSAPSDWSGEYLLVYESSATAGVAWTGVDAALCNVNVSISNGEIATVPSTAVTLTIASMQGGYSIKVNGGTNNGKYISGTSGSNKTNFVASAVAATLAYDGTGKSISITSNTSVMRYNSGNTGQWFRFYKSSTYTNQKAVQLYKKTSSITPTDACAAPTFSPEAGAVLSGTQVTISCSTDGAAIHYTTDGSTPTASSPTYSSAITVSAAMTIRAIAVKNGLTNSEEATAAYTILEPKTIAQIMPSSENEGDEFLLNDVTVTYAYGNYTYVKDASGYMLVFSSISGATNGKVLQGLQGKAKVYNNLPEVSTVTKAPTVADGSAVAPVALEAYPVPADLNKYVTMEDVTFASAATLSGSVTNVTGSFKSTDLIFRNSFKLSGVSLTAGTAYRVVGIVQKYNDNFQIYPISFEEIVGETQVATPTFSPAAGTYTEVQSVTISCATDGAEIRYTTNGDEPTSTSTLYEGAISVNEDMTIKAIAIKDGLENSNVASAAYSINLPHSFQVTHHFSTGEGFEFPTGWGGSYAEHEITYTDDKVHFASASHQSGTITDRPVTKDQAVSLILTNSHKLISAVRFDYAQWGTKAQTLTMKYSTDGGETYSNFDPVVSSTDFALQVLTMPEGVNAIQVTGSNSSSQVGLTSIAFDLVNKPIVTKTVTITSPTNGSLTVMNGEDAVSSGEAIEVNSVLTITATPNEGYILAGVTVNGEAYAESTLTLTDDVTIAASFNEYVAPDVNSYILSEIGVENEQSVTGLKVGDKVNLPLTATSCSKVFRGWSANASCAVAPEYAPGAEITLAADNKFYAVYADVADPTWNVATSVEAGDVVVISTNSGYTAHDMKTASTISSSLFGCAASTYNAGNSQITSLAEGTLQFTVGGNATDGWTLMNGTKYLKVTAAKKVNLVDDEELWTISFSGNNATLAPKTGDLTAYNIQYNYNSGTDRFTAYNTTQVAISLYKQVASYNNYSTDCQAAVATPTFSPVAGSYTEVQNVMISTETANATIYYTTNGDVPTTSSTLYEGAIEVAESKTIKAIAVKSGMANSAVATAAYTINLPLSTMDAIFEAATDAGSTATDANIKFNNWVVSGVSTNGKQVYVTDGTKGFIIFNNDGGMGFEVGNVLSGTVACKVQLYKGAAQLTNLSSSTTGISIATGGSVTPAVKAISALSGINTGAPVIINSVRFDGTNLSDGSNEIKPYNSLFAYEALENGTYYNVTGIYLQFDATKEILPRSAEDIVEKDLQPSGISYTPASATIELGEELPGTTFANPNNLTISYSSDNEAVATVSNTGVISLGTVIGTAVITASFAGDATYAASNVTYTITVNPASVTENVVILAVYDEKFYAMSTTIPGEAFTAIAVEYDGSQVTVNSAEDKAAIQWTKKTSGTNTTFQTKDETPMYMKGTSSGAAMSLNANVCNWSWDGTNEYYYIGSRSFFFQNGVGFKNYATSNIKKSGYSDKAQVIAIAAENIVITSKVSAELAYDPASDEITKGDDWSAPTLDNPHNVTITSYASDNEAVATVDGGVIALAGGIGTAHITAHFDGDASYLEGDAVYTITVNAPAPVVTGTTYRKVTSTEDITNGDYLIVYEATSVAFNGALENLDVEGNSVAVTINEGVISGTTAIDAAVFTIDKTAGTLKSASGKYIGVSSNSNGLKQTEDASTYTHTFSIDNDGAVILANFEGSTMKLRYNPSTSAGNLRFRYYKNDGQQAIQLYKRDAYTRTVTEGRYGTICLPRAGKMVGASIYEIAYFGQASNKVFFDEIVNGEMVAGMPYVFLPNENVTELKVVYTSTTEAEEAQSSNGLHGTLSTMTNILASDNIYLVYQNQILHSTVDGSTLAANRAYIKLGEIDPQEPALAPGRRRVSMGVQGEQVATAIDGLNATEVPVKVMIDGQLFIIRGEKMYDATGRLVK